MAKAGILARDERVELVNGEIITMSPIGDRHAYSVDELIEVFPTRLSGRERAICQNPILLDSCRKVQPDVAILKPRDDSYLSGRPGPNDILLLIEVPDTTLEYDRNVKLPMYASTEIPETWIVNIPDRLVEIYTDPYSGEYRGRRVFGHGESVSPSAFPDISIPVSRIAPA